MVYVIDNDLIIQLIVHPQPKTAFIKCAAVCACVCECLFLGNGPFQGHHALVGTRVHMRAGVFNHLSLP